MRLKGVIAGAAVVLLAAVAAVAVWRLTSDEEGLKGTVTFGVLVPSTGPAAARARAKDVQDGADMAARELNENGGVLGRRLRLTVVDDACEPYIGYEAAKSFAEGGGVAGVVGGVCDDAAAREVPVIDAGGIPFLVTRANREDLITPDLTGAYLMNGTLYQQALSAVYWMNYRRAQRLAVLGDESRDSQALGKHVVALLDEAPRLVSLQTLPVGKRNVRTEAKAALESRPDFVLWTGGAASGGALARALHEAGFKGTFTASAASESPAFLAAAGPGGEGAFVTATARPGNLPNAGGWRSRFEAAYEHAPGLDALQAYDAVRTLAQAAKQADGTDGVKISENLLNLSNRLKNFLGVIRFARDHTLLYDNRVILVVKDGDFAWERSLRTDTLQG
jgi:branched-chain amino acid transport system substrate-binding protein